MNVGSGSEPMGPDIDADRVMARVQAGKMYRLANSLLEDKLAGPVQALGVTTFILPVLVVTQLRRFAPVSEASPAFARGMGSCRCVILILSRHLGVREAFAME